MLRLQLESFVRGFVYCCLEEAECLEPDRSSIVDYNSDDHHLRFEEALVDDSALPDQFESILIERVQHSMGYYFSQMNQRFKGFCFNIDIGFSEHFNYIKDEIPKREILPLM